MEEKIVSVPSAKMAAAKRPTNATSFSLPLPTSVFTIRMIIHESNLPSRPSANCRKQLSAGKATTDNYQAQAYSHHSNSALNANCSNTALSSAPAWAKNRYPMRPAAASANVPGRDQWAFDLVHLGLGPSGHPSRDKAEPFPMTPTSKPHKHWRALPKSYIQPGPERCK